MIKILLSTYNGQRYLRPLLDSVISQKGETIRLCVRDDGSSDGTTDILREYEDRCDFMEVEYGRNLGAVGSYLELLRHPGPAEFFAFCDQDDVWFEDKMARARSVLDSAEHTGPVLYVGRAIVVDQNGEMLGLTPVPRKPLAFRNALVQPFGLGCTMVLNAPAWELLACCRPNPANIIMHDFWAYQVVSAFGSVIFDEAPRMKYRIHGLNEMGLNRGIKKWQRRLRRLRNPRGDYHLQHLELLKNYADRLDRDDLETVTQLVNCIREMGPVARIRYALKPEVYRHTPWGNAFLRFSLAIGRL